MSPFTLCIRDFRVLERLEWSPTGVCVLSGANGTGKTTTLTAIRFLRVFFTRGIGAAFRTADGVAFQRWGADPDTPVEFSIETEDIEWKLRFPMSAQGVKGTHGEELHRAGQVVLRAAMFQDGWYLGTELQRRDEQRCCAKVLADQGTAPWMQPLVSLLEGTRTHDAYWLNQVRSVEPISVSDSYLHSTGRNLWSVLANWKGPRSLPFDSLPGRQRHTAAR